MEIAGQLSTFYQYCELQGLSPRTIQSIRDALRVYLRNVEDPYCVTASEAIAFFAHGKASGFASDRPASPWHYNNMRKYLNKFYRWAVDFGHTDSNPISKVPTCKTPKRIPRRLSRKQSLSVLYHAFQYPHPSCYLRYRNYAMIAMLLMTGLRARELLSLHNEDVDLKQRMLRVRRGKGDKERLVFFNRELATILTDYLRERKRLGKAGTAFFQSFQSNLGLRYQNLNRMVRIVSQRSQVPFTAHWLRHTYISLLAEQGMDCHSIMAQAGHTSLKSTEVYIHLSARHRRSAIDRILFAEPAD